MEAIDKLLLPFTYAKLMLYDECISLIENCINAMYIMIRNVFSLITQANHFLLTGVLKIEILVIPVSRVSVNTIVLEEYVSDKHLDGRKHQ